MDKTKLAKLIRCTKCFGSDLFFVGDFLQCSRCEEKYLFKDGRIFFSEVPKDAKMHDETKKYSRDFSFQRKVGIDYFKQILEKEDRNKIFFDMGIGTNRLQELTKNFNTKIGVDFVPYSSVHIVTDLTRPLPIQDSSADIVFITEVLEHIPNPFIFISEISRILKPDGYCLGSVPFFHLIHSAPYDFYRYTKFALDKLFRESGFTEIEIKNIGRPFDVYQTFHRSFFNVYAMNATYSSNFLANILAKLLIRLSRKVHSLLLKAFSPLYASIPETDNYVLAYCFKAQK